MGMCPLSLTKLEGPAAFAQGSGAATMGTPPNRGPCLEKSSQSVGCDRPLAIRLRSSSSSSIANFPDHNERVPITSVGDLPGECQPIVFVKGGLVALQCCRFFRKSEHIRRRPKTPIVDVWSFPSPGCICEQAACSDVLRLVRIQSEQRTVRVGGTAGHTKQMILATNPNTCRMLQIDVVVFWRWAASA